MNPLITLAIVGPALAQPWEVHDPARPLPPRVDGAACVTTPPPSDAIVLFDGRSLDAWQTNGAGASWKIADGVAEVAGGSITTRESFGDVQLHLEWFVPESEAGDEGQDRGNSGVFLMSRYEIQVLESVGSTTYADGMAASIYGQYPPLVNPGLGIGKWQSYDIVFRAPRFEGDEVVSPAFVTVLHNGVLVQDDVAFQGPTLHMQRTSYEPHESKLPIMIQDHTDPIRFRNIWVRPLAARDGALSGWAPLFPEGGLGTTFEIVSRTNQNDARNMVEIDADEIRILHDWAETEAPYGYLLSKADYSSYDLEFDYMWGDRKFAPRLEQARDSGILLHVRDASDVWPRCIEYQVMEGDTGTCYKIGRSEAVAVRDGRPIDPSADRTGRAPRWDDHEVEGWNHCRVEVRGDRARFYLNAHLVNELTDFAAGGEKLDSGRIGFQIEAAEVTFRDVRIRPMKP
jgi:hypothetical protein